MTDRRYIDMQAIILDNEATVKHRLVYDVMKYYRPLHTCEQLTRDVEEFLSQHRQTAENPEQCTKLVDDLLQYLLKSAVHDLTQNLRPSGTTEQFNHDVTEMLLLQKQTNEKVYERL